jgi:hypothetical protein
LTSEDKELLQRWAKMQQVNVPIAPKPIVEARGQAASINSNASQTPKNTSTNSAQVKKVSSDSAILGQSTSYQSSERRVQQGTLDLLQQRILGSNSVSTLANQSATGSSLGKDSVSTLPGQVSAMPGRDGTNNRLSFGNNPVVSEQAGSSQSLFSRTQNNSMTSVNQEMQAPQSGAAPSSSNFSVDFSNLPIGDLSNVPLGDIDFLSMMPSPEIASIFAQNIPDELQQNSVAAQQQNFNELQNQQMYSGANFNQTSFTSQPSTNEFIENLCSEAASVDARPASDHFVSLDLQQNKSPNTLSVSPNFTNRVSPTAQYGHSPGSHHSLSPNQQISPNVYYDSSGNQTVQDTQGYPQSNIPTHPGSNLPSYQGNSIRMNEMNPADLFMQSRQAPDQIVTQSNQNFMFGNQSDVRNQNVAQSNQNFGNRIQTGAQEFRDSCHSSSNSNSPPSLSVNTQQAQMTYRRMFQEPVAGPSNVANQLVVSIIRCP